MSVYQSAPAASESALIAQNFDFWYGDFHALTDVNLNIAKNKITAFIGPSGCGKSTFLRCMNRMNDLIEGTRIEGTMTLDGSDIYAEGVDPVDLRRRVGMIFQQPNPFPKSIYENVAFGPRLQGVTSKSDLDDIVEESLKRANLWKEVSNQLLKGWLGALRRTAAATMHRPRAGGSAGRALDGRALLGHRSHLRSEGRGPDGRARARDDHHHRHP